MAQIRGYAFRLILPRLHHRKKGRSLIGLNAVLVFRDCERNLKWDLLDSIQLDKKVISAEIRWFWIRIDQAHGRGLLLLLLLLMLLVLLHHQLLCWSCCCCCSCIASSAAFRWNLNASDKNGQAFFFVLLFVLNNLRRGVKMLEASTRGVSFS